jgi:chromosome segregation ATPase
MTTATLPPPNGDTEATSAPAAPAAPALPTEALLRSKLLLCRSFIAGLVELEQVAEGQHEQRIEEYRRRIVELETELGSVAKKVMALCETNERQGKELENRREELVHVRKELAELTKDYEEQSEDYRRACKERDEARAQAAALRMEAATP